MPVDLLNNSEAAIKDSVQGGFLRDHYYDLQSVAILFDRCNNNQLYFYASVKLSKFFSVRGDLCISFYTINSEPPILWPQTALRNTSEFPRFRGIAIATSLATLDILQKNEFVDKYFYVFDMVEIQSIEPKKLRELTKGCKIITRNEEYAQVLREYFELKNIESNYMPDINYDRLIPILGV